jgi:hypothetical protein
MYDHLPDALTRRFQLGPNPEKRRQFYKRLVALCAQYGEPCFRQVKIVAAEAASKNKPGNWFCAAVVRRLQDHGFVELATDLDAPAAVAGKVVA